MISICCICILTDDVGEAEGYRAGMPCCRRVDGGKRLRLVHEDIVTKATPQLFMIKTGFYDIVIRKESERQLEIYEEEEAQLQRLQELGVIKRKSEE